MQVLVISDIHANLVALDGVLADAEEIGFDEVWCLGDVVGYGPDPNACIERLANLTVPLTCVAGNHDWAVLGRMNDEDFNPEARRAIEWTRAQLTASSRRWLEALPESPLERGPCTLTHGSPRNPIYEYILTPSVALANFAYFRTPYCLVGHTHLPVIYYLPEDEQEERPVCRPLAPSLEYQIALAGPHRLILNPGSVGQPRDGDPRASYALFDAEEEIWTYRRLAYSFETTQARMRAADLPERLIARLAYGW